jgi:hypothetical protein
MHSHVGGLEIEFDFIDHVLELRTSAGERRHLALKPQTVAAFYGEVTGALSDLGLNLTLFGRPVEVRISIPFAQDDQNLGEFLLPYEAVRVAEDRDAMLLEFFQTTYEAAAELAGWDRAALETNTGR